MNILAKILPVIFSVACASDQQSPLSEYLAGVHDAVSDYQAQHPDGRLPRIMIDPGDGPMGECKVIAGVPVVYIRPVVILRGARDVQRGRSLLHEVLLHELGHAALTCSEADHAASP